MYKVIKFGKNLYKYINFGGTNMDTMNLKNIVVLRDLPSNLVEEAIIVLKENKKIKKYQYIDIEKKENIENIKNNSKEESQKSKIKDNVKAKDYIIKEAEMLVENYLDNLEKKSVKSKINMKKLENKYKKSLRLNILLVFSTIMSIIISLI